MMQYFVHCQIDHSCEVWNWVEYVVNGGSSLTNYCMQILQIGGENTMAEGGIHGSITSFNSEQEEWVDYVERVENYFIANTTKRAIILSGVGS